MLILNVTYRTKKGMRKEFLDAVKKLQVGEKSRAEEGNIAYEYFLHIEDEDCVFLLEKWRDEEAFEAHSKMEHFLALQGVKEQYLQSADLQKYYKSE